MKLLEEFKDVARGCSLLLCTSYNVERMFAMTPVSARRGAELPLTRYSFVNGQLPESATSNWAVNKNEQKFGKKRKRANGRNSGGLKSRDMSSPR